MKIYLLSCTDMPNGGGVYAYELTENGRFEKLQYFSCDRPMYAVKCEKGLCVLLRQPFKDSENSGYFYIDQDLQTPSKLYPAKGKCACHLAVDGEDVYVVNYLSGNVVKNGTEIAQRQGASVHPIRQTEPHTHYVGITSDGLLAVADLGTDTLAVYDKKLRCVSETKAPSGYGIRHLIFSKDEKFIYAVNELVPSISVFAYEKGKSRLLNTVTLDCEKENASGAAIRLSENGERLYVSVREENALYVYAVNGEELSFLQKTDSGGDSPRDFGICDRHIVCCNEKSGNVTVYRMDGLSFKKTDEIRLTGALCCAY